MPSFSKVRTFDTPKPPTLNEATVAAALSEDYARRILSVCVRKAKSVREIEQETQLAQATVYRYIKQLSDSNLLVVERSAITSDGKRYDLYRSRLRTARVELDGSGVRVAWEPMEAVEEKLARVWNSLKGV